MASRGAVSIDVVADTSKFAAQVQRELAAIMRKIRVSPVEVDGDTAPLVRSARRAAAEVDSSYAAMFGQLRERAGRLGEGIGTALGVGIKAALSTAIQPALASVVSLLASIGPALLPAIPAAVAVFGTLKVALLGVGEALKNVGDQKKFDEALKSLSPNAVKFAKAVKSIIPELNKVKLSVQDRFFADLDKDAKGVTKTLIGPLGTGMTNTASQLNRIVRSILDFAASAKGAAVVNTIFDVTSKVLARIGNLFGPLLTRVGEWIVRAGNSGVNARFAEAEKTLRSLVATAKNVGSAIGSLFGGLGKDGPTVAATLEKASKAVKDFLASAEAQEVLKTLGTAMDRVREIALKVLEALPKILPAINGLTSGGFDVLATVVDTVVTALTSLGTALGSQEGFFKTLGAAIAITVVAVKAYQAALVLVTAAQVTWTVVTTVASVAMQVATAIYNTTRVAALLLGTAWTTAGVQASLLATKIYAQITAMATAALSYARVGIAAVASAASQVASLAVVSAQWLILAARQLAATVVLAGYTIAINAVRIATIAWTAIQWLLNAALTANPIGIIIVLIVALVAGLILAYKKSDTFRAIVDAAFRAVGAAALWLWENALKPLWEGIKFGFDLVIAGAKLWWSVVVTVFNAVVAAAVWLYTNWKKGFDLVVSAIVFVATKVGEFNSMVIGFFTGMVTAVGTKISNLITFVTGIPGKIMSALGNLGSLLKEAGGKIIQGLIDGIDGMIEKLKKKVGQAVQGIRDFLPFSPAKVGPLSGDGAPERSGMRIVEGIAHGIDRQRAMLRETVAGMAGDLQIAPVEVNGATVGGDGASATNPRGGLRVWPNQPKATPDPLTLVSDGSKMGDLLVEIIAKTVRVRGGDVQKVLGKSRTTGGVA